jgi:hypothetical protein
MIEAFGDMKKGTGCPERGAYRKQNQKVGVDA